MSLDSASAQRSAPAYTPTHTVQAIGRSWAVAAGHALASEAAARVLSAGGNAIDAGVAAGITLGVVHPDMVSFAGVAPILVHLASTGETFEVSGVGPYPRRVSADLFRTKHAGEIPIGLLRSVVPASPDAWCVALERWGTRSFTDSVSAALECAEHGFPTSAFSASTMANNAERYARVTYKDVLSRGLQVMDSTAISLCMDNALPIIVFDLTRSGNIKRIVLGEPVGSIVAG